MSTIQVTNINDLSDNAALVTDNGGIKTDKLTGKTTAGSISVVGEGNSTTTNLQQGLCKVWYEMGNDFLLDDSLNMASVTDDGTGILTYAYTNNMANANYAPTAGPTGGGRNTNFIIVETTSLSTSGAEASTGTVGGTNALSDQPHAMSLHGDLA